MIGRKVPNNCKYWRYQGDHNMIGCKIDGTLCSNEDCDIDRKDPTGYLRERIDKKKRYPNPKFHSLEEEEKYWQTHSPLEEGYEGEVNKVKKTTPSPKRARK